jgi:hypothetical protein
MLTLTGGSAIDSEHLAATLTSPLPCAIPRTSVLAGPHRDRGLALGGLAFLIGLALLAAGVLLLTP